jgi:Terpene synthase family 2, C-terminal metal binding
VNAVESGRICAVAGKSQREMREWAAAYPGLYDVKVFDPALFSTLALAAAFSGPWFTGDQLRMANRVCLWCFGLDWLIDHVATSSAEVRGIVRRVRAVADGGPAVPGDDLTLFLADIRDELGTAAAFPALRDVWRDEFQRMLDAMVLEWEWKMGTKPTFDEYLANADNLGFSFVLTAHWISTGEPGESPAAEVRVAAGAVQKVIRLLNDLGTYERDLKWGDLNGLMLGVGREDIDRRIAELTTSARELLRPLQTTRPLLAHYMERQMDFCAGFYGVTDYWGSL